MYIAKQDERRDVYAFNNEGEYTLTLEDELIQEGTGLPANSTLIEVILHKEGFARIFNEDAQKWEYIEDHRGEKYYSIDDASKVEIKELGKLPDNLTDKPRPDQFHIFQDGEWVLDQSAKDQAEKQSKIDALNAEMAKLRNDIIFGQAMGDDVSKEIARVKEIREELANLQ